MNVNQLTQKSLEAIQAAQSIALENQNQQICPEHLLYALLDQDGGLIGSLMEKMGVDTQGMLAAVNTKVETLPAVTGSGREPGSVYVSPDTDRILAAAEKDAKSMQDEYVSVEHIFLAMTEKPNGALSQIFRQFGITRDAFLKALAGVKTSRVTGDNPEETYEALKKYGFDLVERAREQKLDPVIGRDEEIRNVIRILSRKTKNNPVLIGEPGVGKTAIVEGLAQRILRGDARMGSHLWNTGLELRGRTKARNRINIWAPCVQKRTQGVFFLLYICFFCAFFPYAHDISPCHDGFVNL